jgi:PadR family transcriptional regulator
MAKEKSDLLQGTLDMLILKTLALQPMRGYAIAQRIGQMSRALLQVPQGSLYPALHRLENRGLLAADWADSDTGRRTKVYRLTRKGRQHLQHEIADWRRLKAAIALILEEAQ